MSSTRTALTGAALHTAVAGSLALTTATLPLFLVGALSGTIGEDLGLTETAIGGTATVLFLAAAATAVPAGRLAERIGASRALRSGVILSGLAMAAIGAVAQAWAHLAAAMIVVGFAVALIDTGAARAFADRIPATRQGLAFGIKEASIPGASLLAGLSLPTLGTLMGWRATFLTAIGVAVAVLLMVPSMPVAAPEPEADGAPAGPVPRAVRLMAVAAGLGTGAATAAATFLVPGAVARGVTAAVAGVLLAVASVASITVRVAAGRWADGSDGSPVTATAVLLGVGASGAALLALPAPTAVVAVGAVAVLGGGWGWTGLAFLASTRASPDSPATAAGVVLTGLAAGGSLGPLAFGALAEAAGYATAWSAAAAALATAGAAVWRAPRQ